MENWHPWVRTIVCVIGLGLLAWSARTEGMILAEWFLVFLSGLCVEETLQNRRRLNKD